MATSTKPLTRTQQCIPLLNPPISEKRRGTNGASSWPTRVFVAVRSRVPAALNVRRTDFGSFGCSAINMGYRT